MKNNKKLLIGILIGMLMSVGVVYASYKYQATDVGYTPSNSNFNVDNVEDAINELYNSGYYKVGTAIYYNPVSNTKCTKSQVNTNYTQNGNNGIPTEIKTGCMKWYVIHDDGDMVSVISDHNTTAIVKWNETENKNVDYTNSNVKTEVDKLVSVSNWQVKPRLITAEEVNTIIGGVSTWDISDVDTWFYFEGTGTNNQQLPDYSSSKRSKYAWLYNNLLACGLTNNTKDYGCEIEDNNASYDGIGTAGTGFATGYWTSSVVSKANSGTFIWHVYFQGRLINANANTGAGIRPVITISKSIIK